MTVPKPPSRKEFLEIIISEEELVTVLKGAQCIETVLNILISEALPRPHILEIRRIPIQLKVDFAIALGFIQQQLRPVFVKINKIRNNFAHNQNAKLVSKEVRELYKSILQYDPGFKSLVRVDSKEYFTLFRYCIAFL